MTDKNFIPLPKIFTQNGWQDIPEKPKQENGDYVITWIIVFLVLFSLILIIIGGLIESEIITLSVVYLHVYFKGWKVYRTVDRIEYIPILCEDNNGLKQSTVLDNELKFLDILERFKNKIVTFVFHS